MKFRRKRKGSSFIFVIIMFMFVMTVSTAMLSMVSGNYVSRVSESKRIENLYGAESGLDIAYNIAAKTIEEANQYATDCTKNFQEKVEMLEKESKWTDTDSNIIIDIDGMSTTFFSNDIKNLYSLYSHIDYLKALQEDKSSEINLYNEYIDEFLNYIFKDRFKNYINNNLKTNIVGETINNIQNGKINDEYVSYGKDVEIVIDKVKDDGTLNWDDLDSKNISKDNLVVKYKYNDDGKIIPDIQHSIEFICKNQTSDIVVKSNFTTDRNNTNKTIVGKNPKEIQVTFSIAVPNYDEISFKNSITYPNVKDIPGLTVGGDMIIDDSNVNVTGDIFVQGTTPIVSAWIPITPSNRTYKKYDSGIKINNKNVLKNKINFNDNVYTRETFNIKNNVGVNIKGDLYAKNIYAGYTDDSNKNNFTQNSSLTVNNNVNANNQQKVILDNDLAIKANNTNILIDNFYGISDINGETNEGVERKSSSIIVNNQNSTSNITIENEAYIAGVAHINTEGDDGYQTGESVAVKGNYNAYSVPQSGDDQFEYHNPLQLLEGTLPQKATHFFEYWKDKVYGDNSVDCGGVIFSNPNQVKSVGALVYKDGDESKVAEPSFPIEDFNNLSTLRREYAKYIYKLTGDKTRLTDDYLNKLYDGNEIQPETVQDDILENLSENYGLPDNLNKTIKNNGSKIIIFSSDSNNSIVIKGNKNSGETGDYMIDASGENANNNVNAVIVTSGNVIIDGDVNFRGNIITSGNLEIKGNGTVNLYYDPTLTKDIQNENLSIFKEVFGDDYGGDNLEISESNNISNGASLLKTKQWRIIK